MDTLQEHWSNNGPLGSPIMPGFSPSSATKFFTIKGVSM